MKEKTKMGDSESRRQFGDFVGVLPYYYVVLAKNFDRSRRWEQKHSELLVSSYIGSEYVFGSVPNYCNIT